jgi:ABC-type sugar transport system substrate-binding protein
MAVVRKSGTAAVALLSFLGGAAAAQPASAPTVGTVGTIVEATSQDYASRLRDGEASRRA